jgi:PPP family 3-phenylpropionic acid transporter
VLGGLTGGLLSSAYGLVSVYWACAVASAIATFCAWRAWRLQRGLDAAASPAA